MWSPCKVQSDAELVKTVLYGDKQAFGVLASTDIPSSKQVNADIPSVKIGPDNAVLIKYADTALTGGEDCINGRIFILVQMKVEGMDL